MRPGGETGRRTGLKIPGPERDVPVRFRSRAPCLVDVASVNAGSFGLWKNGHCACFVLSSRNSFLNLLCSQPQIRAGHDVVTIKNVARFVAADRHRYALRHTAPDHVAESRAPKVVKNEFRHTTCFYQLGPSVTEITHLFAILAREHKIIPLGQVSSLCDAFACCSATNSIHSAWSTAA